MSKPANKTAALNRALERAEKAAMARGFKCLEEAIPAWRLMQRKGKAKS